jgi:hypothetical protein
MTEAPMSWLLWMCLPALAGDLTQLVEAWRIVEPSGGDGAARTVFFEDDGTITATGWAIDDPADATVVGSDGKKGVVNDGRIVTYDATGATVELFVDEDGVHHYWYETLRDDDRLIVCGERVVPPSADTEWYAATFDADGSLLWQAPYKATGSSDQGCRGIDRSPTMLYTAGYTLSGAAWGQWHLWALNPGTGLVTQQSVLDFGRLDGFVDQAHDIAVYPDDTTVVVGAASIEERDAYGELIDTRPGARVERREGGTTSWSWQIDDPTARFDAVTVDDATGRTAVVGSVGGQGLLLGFNQSSGAPEQPPLWEVTWPESPSGITGVAVDTEGAILALGWIEVLGTERWVVVRYDNDDGTELDRKEIPAFAGSSRPYAADTTDELLVVSGTIDDGDGPRFGLMLFGLDRDGDLVPDLIDLCPDDVGKADPGVCGCDVPDTDLDGDGALGCEEACPTDPDKLEPGVCGCDEPDIDSDGDGALDCEDECPDDGSKPVEGVCGCGTPDSDDDGDGYLICQDQCPDTPPGVAVDGVGCALVDSADTAPPEDTGDASKPALDTGCGCDTASPFSAGWLLLLLPALARRRRTGSAGAPAC